MDGKRKATFEIDGDVLEITPLGAGQEVGRSCVLVEFKGKIIMLDCGIHPAKQGIDALPYFDHIEDTSKIDLLLITHFHLDHCGTLPYFMQKTKFRGRVFMTHPTKAIYKMILSDYVKVSNIATDEMLYDESDLNATMSKIELIDYHQDQVVNGIKFCAYNAGHVLGAAMFMIEIAGVKILYTGDFSRQEDRHLMAAETPSQSPDVLVVESTYGVQIHEPRKDRETRFTKTVHEIVARGGRCLIPVFALGRAQELLLILDEYWIAHPELHHVPIYYASSLAKKCMDVYRNYINYMNKKIKDQFTVSNPFIFKHISNLSSVDKFDDSGPSVVMASPGMLQSGISRELFERWCSNPKNGVLVPGYCVEGTLAKHIMSEPATIKTSTGLVAPLKMSVTYISFSAHSDYIQTSGFIDILMPPYVVLVHGDSNAMARLKAALVDRYKGMGIEVLTPKNAQTVYLKFKSQKIARVIGSLASAGSDVGKAVQGILVRRNFKDQIVSPDELNTYTQLLMSTIQQNLKVPFHQPFDLLKQAIEHMYEDVTVSVMESSPEGEEGKSDKKAAKGKEAKKSTKESNPLVVTVHGNVRVEEGKGSVTLKWASDATKDMIADSIVALALQLESNPSYFKKPEEEDVTRSAKDAQFVKETLASFFGDDVTIESDASIGLEADGMDVDLGVAPPHETPPSLGAIKSEPVDESDHAYSSLTVPLLKEELKRRGLPVSGRKAELIARLSSAHASNEAMMEDEKEHKEEAQHEEQEGQDGQEEEEEEGEEMDVEQVKEEQSSSTPSNAIQVHVVVDGCPATVQLEDHGRYTTLGAVTSEDPGVLREVQGAVDSMKEALHLV